MSSFGKNRAFFFGRLAFCVLLLVALAPFDSVAAKKRKPAPYGTLRIESKPSGLPIEVDGKQYGTTTDTYTAIERLEPGVHTVVISLPNGQQWRREVNLPAGRVKCIYVTYRPATVIAASPCPFPVSLSPPAQTSEGGIVSFAANVSYSGAKDLFYKWTVSPASARILNGAGTSKIEVDSTNLGGQQITATVVVDDGTGEMGCRQIAQASTFVAPVERHERVSNQFDVCCSCANDDLKARLDNFAIELNNDPSTTAYVIIYPTGSAKSDKVRTLVRDYLVSTRGIDPSRIVFLQGRSGDEGCVELWLVPKGATPPTPKR